jgi:hypothetical protein
MNTGQITGQLPAQPASVRLVDVGMVLAIYLVSRGVYAWLGLEFDASTFPRYFQFIDKPLLAERMLESIWYSHAFPPLLNVLAGIAEKVFGSSLAIFVSIVFHVMGYLTALCVLALTMRLSASRIAAYVVVTLLVFSPAFVMYENWFMYTFPAAAMLTISVYLLLRYLDQPSNGRAFGFFLLLAAICLTRGVFHLAWFVMIAFLLVVFMRNHRRQLLLAAVLPFMLVAGWYGKNMYYFGTFAGSTMLGFGLSNITTLTVTREELAPLVKEGVLTPFALVSRYADKDIVFSAMSKPPTGIPVLDVLRKSTGGYNYDNQQIIEIERYYRQDAIEVAKRFRLNYLAAVWLSNRLFFSPSSMNTYFSDVNREAALPMEELLNPVLYGTGARMIFVGQPHFGFDMPPSLEMNVGYPLVFVWILLVPYFYMRSRKKIRSASPGELNIGLVTGYMLVNILYVWGLSTTVELAENFRYKFLIEPIFMILVGIAICDLIRMASSAFGRSAGAKAG